MLSNGAASGISLDGTVPCRGRSRWWFAPPCRVHWRPVSPVSTGRRVALDHEEPMQPVTIDDAIYLEQYGTVLALIIAGILLVAVAFLLARLVSPDREYRGFKYNTYESGIDPVGQGWSQTHIRYYMFAFMFVVFDVETLFVFPWATVLGRDSNPAPGFMLGTMLVFLFFVTITLPYEWKKGVLKWV
jgi:NADH-quinone oxidoreductase subunit A